MKIKNSNDVIILTDCQSVLMIINNNRLNVYKNKYILDIKKLYFELTNRYKIKIVYVWIPAHLDFTGNEIADNLAKERANEQEDPTIEIPINDVRTIFTEAWKKHRKLYAESIKRNRVFFAFL